MRRGILTLDELRERVETGSIDTVITAVPDMQGRLVGKRVTAEFFLDHCLDHGTHFCTYLMATDVELNTPEGFGALNWESGYGDYQARPDWATLRHIPWLEKTAVEPASVAPRMKALRTVGVPYTDEQINAAADEVKGKTEMDALVAYLQVMGRALK